MESGGTKGGSSWSATRQRRRRGSGLTVRQRLAGRGVQCQAGCGDAALWRVEAGEGARWVGSGTSVDHMGWLL
jgi:hypothetical protein